MVEAETAACAHHRLQRIEVLRIIAREKAASFQNGHGKQFGDLALACLRHAAEFQHPGGLAVAQHGVFHGAQADHALGPTIDYRHGGDRCAMADHHVDLVTILVGTEAAIVALQIRAENFGDAGTEGLDPGIGQVGPDATLRPGKFGQRRWCLQRFEIRRRLEDRRVVQIDAQRHMLGLMALRQWIVLIRIGRREQGDIGPMRLLQDQLQPVGITQFGNPVQVGHQPFGPVRRWPLEILGQFAARVPRIVVERCQLKTISSGGMPFDQFPHQAQIDGLEEFEVHEFLDVFPHALTLRARIDVPLKF